MIDEPQSNELVRQSAPRPKAPIAFGGIVAGLMAGVVVGWAIRGSVGNRTDGPPPSKLAHAKSAEDLSAAHAKSQFVLPPPDPSSSTGPESKPPTTSPSKQADAKPKPPPTIAPPKLSGKGLGNLRPQPSNLGPALPPMGLGGNGLTVTPAVDLHRMEAKVRVIVNRLQGTVVSSHDVSIAGTVTARDMVVRVPSDQSDALLADVKSDIGSSAVVGDPQEMRDSNSDIASVEYNKEQLRLETVRKRVEQARLDFYQDAPALKDLESEYADEIRQVERLKKKAHPPVKVSITLNRSI